MSATDPALAAYLAEASAWDDDRLQRLAASERRAWRVAGAAVALAVAIGAGLAALAPLKRVEPFVIRVDNSTGVVDVVPVLASSDAVASDAVHRYFVSHYVRLRERFNPASVEQDYFEVAAFNAPAANQDWLALWQAGNPASPLERHRDGSTVRIEVRSVSFFERARGVRDLAQVRFARFTRAGAGGAERVAYHIATVQFAYGKPAADPQQRQWNPLGFRVLSYQVDAEAEPAVSAAVAASEAPGTVDQRTRGGR